MSDQSHKPLPIPKIRTFAGDLKEQKDKRSSIKNETLTDSAGKGEEKARPNQTPEPITKTTKKPIPIPKLRTINEPLTAPITVEEKSDSPLKKSSIPAYHELQKKINKIDADSKSKYIKPVAPIKVGGSIDKKNGPKKINKKPNLGYDATIITDTKKHNPDFFPTVIQALSDWVRKILTPKPKAAPKYTIADSSTRKGVIQKATTKTGSIFTADNESLKEQIRKRRLAEAHSALQQEETETSWSPYTETGYNLLEPADKPVSDYKPIPAVPEAFDNEDVTPIEKTTKHELDFDEQRWSNSNEVETEITQLYVDEDAKPHMFDPVPEAPDTKEQQETVTPTTPENVPDNETEEAEKKRVVFSESIEEVDTNTMSVMVLMVIIGLVSIVLVGRLVYQYISTSLDEPVVPTSRVTNLLNNSSLHNLTLTTSDLDNVNTLIDDVRLSSSDPILEIALTDIEGNELSPAYIFELLNFSMMPTMKQSVTKVRFISVDTKEEMVMLTFNNEENIRGGFLNWENQLSSDLNALYNTPLSNNNFSDHRIAELDTRELVNEDGTIITYSLVNDTTALITISKTDLERIINLEFKP